jgi:hypothetical protein
MFLECSGAQMNDVFDNRNPAWENNPVIVIANAVKQSRKTVLGRHGYRLAMTE